MGRITCNSCGANYSDTDLIKYSCEYCGSALSFEYDGVTTFTKKIESKVTEIIDLIQEWGISGFRDNYTLEQILSKIISLPDSEINRIKSKFDYAIVFYSESIIISDIKAAVSIIKSFKEKGNKIELLNHISQKLIDELINNYRSDILKEYNYYTDPRYSNLNDSAFQNKKKQVIANYNERNKELKQIIQTLNL